MGARKENHGKITGIAPETTRKNGNKQKSEDRIQKKIYPQMDRQITPIS
jgi:hypothetical protein